MTTSFLQQLPAFEYLQPFYTCILLTIGIFSITYGFRRINDYIFTNSGWWREFAGILCLCSCIFQEEIIYESYGHIAMFVAILINCKLREFFHPSHTENSALLLEEGLIRRRLFYYDSFCLLVIHLFCSYLAAGAAIDVLKAIWRYTGLEVSMIRCPCREFVSLEYVGVIQFFATFALRAVLHKLATPEKKKYHVLVYAVFFVGNHFVTGFTGMNPALALSMLTGCAKQKYTAETFFFVYVFCGTFGWMLAAYFFGDTPMRSIHREKVERYTEAQEAARIAALTPLPPQFVPIRRGNRRIAN